MIWAALAAMIGATLAQHLGLTEAIGRILQKIARCPKCCSFWLVLVLLVNKGVQLATAAFIALAMAYLSYWVGIGLYKLNRLYEKIWQRARKR